MSSEDPGTYKQRQNKFRFLKWFLGILSVVILSVVLMVFIFLDGIIKSKIIKEVNYSSQGLYKLEIANLDAKFWTGAIAMKDVWLRPDPQTLSSLKAQDTSATIPDVNLHFDSVNISSIKWLRYLMNNEKLEIGIVLIDKPDFIIHTDFQGDASIKNSEQNFLDFLPGIIAAFTGSLRIEEIVIKDGHLHHDLHTNKGVVHQLADSVYIDLKKITIDTLSPKNALYSKEAYIDLRNYTLTTPNNLNKLVINKIAGVIHDSILTADGIIYSQKDSVKEIHKDAIKISIHSMDAKGLDYGNLLKDQKIFLRSMVLQSPEVKLHSSENPVEKYAQTVNKIEQHKSILDRVVPYLSGSFRIDALAIKDGKINYEIKNNKNHIVQSATNIHLNFSRILVDTTSAKSDLYVENMNVSLKNYLLRKDNESELNIGSLKASIGDSTLVLKEVKYENKQNDLYNISTSEVLADGINYARMLEEKKVDLNSLIIVSPSIDIYSILKLNREKKHSSSNDFFENALGPFSDATFRANRLTVKNAEVNVAAEGVKGVVQQCIKDLTLDVYKVSIDSSVAEANKLYEYFNATLNGYELKVNKANIKLLVNEVKLNSKRDKIYVNNIVLTQIKSFGPDQRFYFVDSIHSASIIGFDYNRFINSQDVYAQSLDINTMDLKIYYDGDKDLKVDSTHRMPHDLFQKINFNLTIDTVAVRNSTIFYSGKEKGMAEPGILTFESFNAGISNLSNERLRMSDSTPALIKGNTKVLGDGLLDFHVEIQLLSKDFNAHYGGVMGTMNGDKFNSLLRSDGIRIERGRIWPSTFEVEVINGVAIGEVQFVYRDLHVEIFDVGDKKEKKKKLKSLLGNFVVKNNNPNDDEDLPETVSVCARITNEDGFFGFIWRVLSDGITRTVTKDSVYKVKNEN